MQLTGEARRGMDTLSGVRFRVAGGEKGAVTKIIVGQGWFDAEPSTLPSGEITGIIDEMPVHFTIVERITGSLHLTAYGPAPFVPWITGLL